MALNFAKKKKEKESKKSDELNKERMVEIYTGMLADLTKEVDEAIKKGRDLVKRGAPPELLVASMAEQYPMMAMYAEEVILTKQGLTRELVLQAVEKFEGDPELDKLLSDITSLSEKFNTLKEENIAVEPLPDHVTKEMILQIAQENADVTLRVIRDTSAQQKTESLTDEKSAEIAETNANAAQAENFKKHNLTQDVMTAAILKFSTQDEAFGQKMQEISQTLSQEMHKMRAAEMGISPEQLAMQQEIQMAAQQLAAQGMSQEQITAMLAQALSMGGNEEDEKSSSTSASTKKKTGKKGKSKKPANKSLSLAANLGSSSSSSAGNDDDEDDDEADGTQNSNLDDVE